MKNRKKRILSSSLALLFIAFWGCESKKSSPQNKTEKETEIVMETETITEEKKETSIIITATGDCTLGSDKNWGYDNSFEQYYDIYGSEYFFTQVKKIFVQDDFTVINLECALTDETCYADKQYVYKGKPEYAKILSSSSIELASLANNHTHDYLEAGFNDTKEALEKEKVKSFSNNNLAYMEKDGLVVAFISVCSWSCNESLLKEYFAQADKNKASLKILCVHWGVNYEKNWNSSQEYFGHLAVDLGADLVLGHHPHVVQGLEIYKDVPIVYSLGNFCYAGKKQLGKERDTMIFQATFQFLDNQFQNLDYQIIPTYMSSKNPQNTYQPTIVENKKEQERILKLIKGLSKFN